jgi:hypothetical protein
MTARAGGGIPQVLRGKEMLVGTDNDEAFVWTVRNAVYAGILE